MVDQTSHIQCLKKYTIDPMLPTLCLVISLITWIVTLSVIFSLLSRLSSKELAPAACALLCFYLWTGLVYAVMHFFTQRNEQEHRIDPRSCSRRLCSHTLHIASQGQCPRPLTGQACYISTHTGDSPPFSVAGLKPPHRGDTKSISIALRERGWNQATSEKAHFQ